MLLLETAIFFRKAIVHASTFSGELVIQSGYFLKRATFSQHNISAEILFPYILKWGTSWIHLELAGTTWNHLEPSGASWNHLEEAGTTWSHLKRKGTTYIEMDSGTKGKKRQEIHRKKLCVQHHRPIEYNYGNSYCHKEHCLRCLQVESPRTEWNQ